MVAIVPDTRRPVSVSSTTTPVTTVWSLSRRAWSISHASASVAGLPMIRASTTTALSAPMTTPPPASSAPRRALAAASRATIVAAGSPGSRPSSTEGLTARNGSPMSASISRLRGDSDARISSLNRLLNSTNITQPVPGAKERQPRGPLTPLAHGYKLDRAGGRLESPAPGCHLT